MNNSTGSGMILVIEKNAKFTSRFKQHLRIDGYRCFFVESGQDALFLLDSMVANFILINLNGVESWENLKAINVHARKNNTKVLYIDGLKRTQPVADRLRDKGVTDFISLPFSVSDLKRRIVGMLGGVDPLLGLRLGPEGQEVEILKRLGSGAMGAVYKANQADLGRQVAVKFLSEEALKTDPQAGARFYNEARAMAQMRSPNIVQVYFVGKYQDRPYIVMEYIEGPNLEKYIRNKGILKPLEALRIMRQVFIGLSEAHGRGKIHRDMKPGNIMLNRDGSPVILDFGLVREQISENMTRAGTILGTPRYMSPEQVRGNEVDHRCDLYAVGIMLYEMMVGVAPFKGKDFVSILMKHVNEPLPDPEEHGQKLPEDVFAFVKKLSAKSPDDRYQTAEEALAIVDQLLAALDAPVEVDTATFHNVRGITPLGGLAVNSEGVTVNRFGNVPESRAQHLYLLSSLLTQISDAGDLGSFQRGHFSLDERRLIVFPNFEGLAGIETSDQDATTDFNALTQEQLNQLFEKVASP